MSEAVAENTAPDNKPWFWVPVHKTTMQKILQQCGVDPAGDNSQARLLDFGCGAGRYLSSFSDYFLSDNLYGVDTDLDALAVVRQLGFQGFPLEPQTPGLPFEDNYFDYVFSSNVIEHIPRSIYLHYLAEIHRVLKPGGLFAVGAPNYPFKRFYDMKKAFKQKTRKERDYYLFDDPTHCNKASILQVEWDLKQHFEHVRLMPTAIFFQKKFSVLRKPDVQYQLRVFGDKFFGTCRKPVN
jgi:SAM-dependent methyltransferase